MRFDRWIPASAAAAITLCFREDGNREPNVFRTFRSSPGASLLGASAASAHHSFAMFDPAKDVMIKGTVSAFSWQNPHAWIDVTVQVDGKGQNRGLESQSVGILYRQGWNADSLKPGDKITAAGLQTPDSSPALPRAAR